LKGERVKDVRLSFFNEKRRHDGWRIKSVCRALMSAATRSF